MPEFSDEFTNTSQLQMTLTSNACNDSIKQVFVGCCVSYSKITHHYLKSVFNYLQCQNFSLKKTCKLLTCFTQIFEHFDFILVAKYINFLHIWDLTWLGQELEFAQNLEAQLCFQVQARNIFK